MTTAPVVPQRDGSCESEAASLTAEDRLLPRGPAALLSGRIQSGIPLAPLTTFRVGGKAEWYCEPRSHLELQQCLAWARAEGIPTTLLGAGSNLLISDAGLKGLVIGTRRLRGMQLLAGGRIWAAAGEPLVNLARAAAKQGWSGLEWAIGIPGTLGGAVVMNAGAHGRAMADVLVEVQILDEEQEPYRLEPADLQFGYRRSRYRTPLDGDRGHVAVDPRQGSGPSAMGDPALPQPTPELSTLPFAQLWQRLSQPRISPCRLAHRAGGVEGVPHGWGPNFRAPCQLHPQLPSGKR